MATAKKAQQEGTVGLIILLVIMGTIIFFAFSISPEARQELIPLKSIEVVFIDDTNFEIPASSVGAVNHDISTMTADFSPQKSKEVLSTASSATRTTFNNQPIILSFSATKANFASAVVTLLVTDTSGGALQAILNNDRIYNNVHSTGDSITILIPPSNVREGRNEFSLSVSSPGFNIGKTNTYSLSDITLQTNSYNSKLASDSKTIDMASSEIAGVKSAVFTALVSPQSDQTSDLAISLNGNEIYSSAVDGDEGLDVLVPTSFLNVGRNTITAEAAKPGKYVIEFGRLTTYSTGAPVKKYNFRAGIGDTTRIEQSLVDCSILIEKASGGESLSIILNGQHYDYTFSGNLIEDTTICNAIQLEANSMSLTSEDGVVIKSLRFFWRQR